MLTRNPKQQLMGGLLLLICFYLILQIKRSGTAPTVPLLAQTSKVGPPEHARPKHEKPIAIVTFITSQKSYIHISLKNKDHYVRRHNYDLIVDYESHADRGVTWLKFDMIERLIKADKYDWIWWMDFDTLITNTGIKLEDIIGRHMANATDPESIDFLVTNDCNGLNDGSFIVRSSPRSIDFFDRVRAVHDAAEKEKPEEQPPNDQESMRDFLKSDDPFVKHARTIPQWEINAFPEEIRCYDQHARKWEPWTFVVHFAGAWAHVKGDDPTGQLMEKYQNDIIWGDWRGLSR